MSMLIPIYIYPWDEYGGPITASYLDVLESVIQYPYIEHILIMNPNNGDDALSVPNEAWTAVLELFAPYRNRNVKMVGYIPTGYGDPALNTDVHDRISGYLSNVTFGHNQYWKSWNNYLDGIFFDEVGDASDSLENTYDRYEFYVNETRNFMLNSAEGANNWGNNKNNVEVGREPVIVFNAGTKYQTSSPADEWPEKWYDLATIFVNYENFNNDPATIDQFNNLAPPVVANRYTRHKFAAILRDANNNSENFKTLMYTAFNNYFGNIFFTSAYDYHSWMASADWWDLMRYVNHGVYDNVVPLNGLCNTDDECQSGNCVGVDVEGGILAGNCM